MKSVLTFAAACSMLALAGVAQADNGTPSQSTLDAMGLSGLQVMSDSEADSVRGFGYYGYSPKNSYVLAYGKSYAHVSGYGAKAGTKDAYYAEGTYYAKGRHGSRARIVVKKGKHGGKGGGGPKGPQPTTNGGGMNGGGNHGGGHKHVKSVMVYAGGYARASAH